MARHDTYYYEFLMFNNYFNNTDWDNILDIELRSSTLYYLYKRDLL